MKVERVVETHRVEEVIAAITAGAQTGKIGDGKIFVTPIETAVRIRTAERGPNAV